MENIIQQLEQQADFLNLPKNHLSVLLKNPDRFFKYSLKIPGFFYDFSRQRLDDATLRLLFEFAERRKVIDRFKAMTRGEKINLSENRAALHTAMRDFSENPVFVDKKDVMPQIRKVRDEIKAFSEQLRAGKLPGTTGQPLRDVVVVGIGGSYLGTECVADALMAYATEKNNLYFLANVDPSDFARVSRHIDPEKTLWIIISKSYTTRETLANENLVRWFLKQKGLDPAFHLATVTSKGSPGDNPDNPVVASFHMFDFVGGRYSVSSAVGGAPLSLYMGYDVFERFLHGANAMDQHAASSPVSENIPLMAALSTLWNKDFLGYPALGIIPYATNLRRLPAHIQQLHMESNGKNVTAQGEPLEKPAGTIIIGEPGTNAQHSFFQMAHQGPAFPVEFIGVAENPFPEPAGVPYRGVTNHQELLANLISQAKALAEGQDNSDKTRFFPGNRPSSTIILDDLTPESVGMLISFYEAKTVFEAFLWNINPFDQFGVQLGKTIAATVREQIMAHNFEKPVSSDDPIVSGYLDLLAISK
ncbi:MAG: glucose-6-phosphate isomerase [Desulfobacterales bacterium]